MELENVDSGLNTKIDNTKTELVSDIDELNTNLSKSLEDTKTELENTDNELSDEIIDVSNTLSGQIDKTKKDLNASIQAAINLNKNENVAYLDAGNISTFSQIQPDDGGDLEDPENPDDDMPEISDDNSLVSDIYTFSVNDETNEAILTGVQITPIGYIEVLSTVMFNDKEYNVTKIGSGAFYNCDDFTHILLESGLQEISNYAFYGCRSLVSITIPNTVTTLGNSVFSNCTSLTEITIPKSVTKIGKNIFNNTNLRFICYTGTEEEWNMIDIDSTNAENLNNIVIYYETQIPSYNNVFGITGLREKHRGNTFGFWVGT